MFLTESWKIGEAMIAGGRALSESAVASRSVIESRTRTIDAAMRNPLTADVAELGRMVPEKIAALTRSGEAIVADWIDIQAELMAQAGDVMRVMLAGRVPSAGTVERIAGRGMRIAVKSAGVFGHALAPLHATVTANARRLGGG